MNLIGINGLKTSGKDAAFKLLSESLQRPDNPDLFIVHRAAFADKLKIMAAKALGFDRSDEELIALMDSFKECASISVLYEEPGNPLPYADDAVLHSLSGREYLQWFGGHARDVFGDTFWIDQVLPRALPGCGPSEGENYNQHELQDRYPGVDVLCVTDARYPNEAKRIRDLGGVMWEVIRPGVESDGHDSEKPLPADLIDWQIINDGNLDLLRERVLEASLETL